MSCTECGQKLNMTEMFKALCRKLITLGQDALSTLNTKLDECPFRDVQISKSLDFNESAIRFDEDSLQSLTQPATPHKLRDAQTQTLNEPPTDSKIRREVKQREGWLYELSPKKFLLIKPWHQKGIVTISLREADANQDVFVKFKSQVTLTVDQWKVLFKNVTAMDRDIRECQDKLQMAEFTGCSSELSAGSGYDKYF